MAEFPHTQMTPTTGNPRPALIRFFTAMAAGNLVWEIGHVPLYTLWQSGTWAEIAFAIIHCTLGDLLIAAVCLGGAVLLFGRQGWPRRNYWPVALATVIAALAYTVFSEWLNTEVKAAWAYREIMPRLPPFGTGLTPVLHWIVVPVSAFLWVWRSLYRTG